MSSLLTIVMFGFVPVDRIGFQGLKLRFTDCQCDQKLSVDGQILRTCRQWVTHLLSTL